MIGSDDTYKQDQLEQLISLFNWILENTFDAIIAMDLSGNIILWNQGAERIYKYTSKEIVGKNISMLQDPKDITTGKLDSIFQTVLETGKWQGNLTIIDRDHNILHIYSYINIRKDSGGKPAGFISVSEEFPEDTEMREVFLRNIESKQSLQAKFEMLQNLTHRAQEANRLKSEFIANVSHELRTPLNSIIGFTEMLFNDIVSPDSPEYKEFLGDILTSSRQLLLLINDILDLSKAESGKIEFHPESINITNLVKETYDVFYSILQKKKLTLTINVNEKLPQIVIDPERLKQIIFNYLSNAVKFTPDEGSITIRVFPKDKQFFMIEVEDNGIGIAESDIPRLFVEFQQLDAGKSKKFGGTGMGLALTKRFVEMQGGTVGVKSTLGKGSIFFACLPLEPIAKQSPTSILLTTPSLDPNKTNLLIVEDNPGDVRLIEEMLKEVPDLTLNIIVADTLGLALKKIATKKISLILLDLTLPDSRGIHAFEELNRFAGHVPIIIMSGIADKELFYKAMQQGAHQYLIKGQVNGEMLSQAIKSALSTLASRRKS